MTSKINICWKQDSTCRTSLVLNYDIVNSTIFWALNSASMAGITKNIIKGDSRFDLKL